MDILDIKPSERIIEIESPRDKTPIGIRVTLMHLDDPRMMVFRRKIHDERARLLRAGKIVKAEVEEENANELAFRAMTSWEWYNKDLKLGDTASPEFNRANVMKVFESCVWFRDQIGVAIGDQDAFF